MGESEEGRREGREKACDKDNKDDGGGREGGRRDTPSQPGASAAEVIAEADGDEDVERRRGGEPDREHKLVRRQRSLSSVLIIHYSAVSNE